MLQIKEERCRQGANLSPRDVPNYAWRLSGSSLKGFCAPEYHKTAQSGECQLMYFKHHSLNSLHHFNRVVLQCSKAFLLQNNIPDRAGTEVPLIPMTKSKQHIKRTEKLSRKQKLPTSVCQLYARYCSQRYKITGFFLSQVTFRCTMFLSTANFSHTAALEKQF